MPNLIVYDIIWLIYLKRNIYLQIISKIIIHLIENNLKLWQF